MGKTPAELAKEIILFQSFEEHSITTLVSILEAADDLYYNSNNTESFLLDSEYDVFRRYAERLDPSNSYFTGVGSDVRGGKIKLPYQMGSLDQVYEGEIQQWVYKWGLGNSKCAITDKLDGQSGMVVYDENGKLQICYSRGNGIMGADITRHVKRFVPLRINQPLVIRGEIIIAKHNFAKINEIAIRTRGKPYKNLRNCVAGMMNSEVNDVEVYEYIDYVAYEILNSTLSKDEMLNTLNSLGFKTPHSSEYIASVLNDDELSNYLNTRRELCEYEIDGIVIDVNDSTKRQEMNPTRDTLNPAYSIKYKILDASNYVETVVEEVEWNLSKHGYLKPRINVRPCELLDTTIQHTTGYNAKYILDNNIGKGTIVGISKMGDVIPNIVNVVNPTQADMPTESWTWNDTEIDAILLNADENEEVIIQQTIDFFTSIEAPLLKEGNIRKVFDHFPYDSSSEAITAMIKFKEDSWFHIIGENGNKIYKGLQDKLNGIPLYVIMGSVPFFGRGVGKRKFKKLLMELNENVVFNANAEDLITVDGFERKTANKICVGMGEFLDWFGELTSNGLITISQDNNINGDLLAGEKVCMTGFRDKELMEQVEAEGGVIQSGISKKTTILVAANPNSNSGKMKKAKEYGIRIMGIADFKEMLS